MMTKPRIPRPRPPQDRVECTGCRQDFPFNEIRERGGWPYCGDCEGPATTIADRNLTRQLAYAA